MAAGDVVIADTGNDSAFTTTTTAGITKPVGIAQATIANNAAGSVAVQGHVALVNVPSSQTRGQYLATHTAAKQATGAASRTAGSFGYLETGGTTPAAYLFGVPDLGTGSGSTSPLTTKGDMWGFSTVDARVPIGSDTQVLTADSTQALGLKWAAAGGGGATIQYPALKPGSPTYDFATASLPGALAAHSSGGSFATGSCITQGIDWMGSSLEMQYSAQFGVLYVTHADTDFDFTWGGICYHGGFTETAGPASELMYGIAALNSSGTGVGVVSYTADQNAYLATISTWGYNTFSDTWTNGGGGTRGATHGEMWMRLKRVSGTWTGYISKSGRVWDFTFATRADSITVDRLAIGIWYDSSKVYSGRLTSDYLHVAV